MSHLSIHWYLNLAVTKVSVVCRESACRIIIDATLISGRHVKDAPRSVSLFSAARDRVVFFWTNQTKNLMYDPWTNKITAWR
jgi:hypothetical protein